MVSTSARASSASGDLKSSLSVVNASGFSSPNNIMMVNQELFSRDHGKKGRATRGTGRRRTKGKRTHAANSEQEEDMQKCFREVSDILQLSDLTEENILKYLCGRYDQDAIYTFVGPMVIAINPYKPLPHLYTDSNMLVYHGKKPGQLPPHVFVLAEAAYSELVHGNVEFPSNQSIIISGESGAGKTETTKIIMQYLARITKNDASAQTSEGQSLGKLEERVLDSNPLLESFGNAKTLRNDNSSRFGKFIEIQFDNYGKIVGAEIMNFLLEKTRIVTQNPGERNYHIFYQLLLGACDQFLADMKLTNPEHFHYLNQGDCFLLHSRDDKSDFAITQQCMKSIGISTERQDEVFQCLAAVLHLGNITFSARDETCTVSEGCSDSVKLVSQILRVTTSDLEDALCSRQLYVDDKIIVQVQTVEQARDKRDALAKAIYSSIFQWLVVELNQTISSKNKKWGFIGVLDIYGFEKFNFNSFEQLLINYANEKLQYHFNEHMLAMEQDDYQHEDIDWEYIEFQNNQRCLDLIEATSTKVQGSGSPGLLSTLDDVWRMNGLEADRKFVSYLHANFGRKEKATSVPTTTESSGVDTGTPGKPVKRDSFILQHEFYIHPKMDQDYLFGIKHYAGEVIYDATGFNDKNKESLSDDVKILISKHSQREWLRDIFDASLSLRTSDQTGSNNNIVGATASSTLMGRRPLTAAAATPDRKSRTLRELSVGSQFRSQLQELMKKLSSSHPRYIRCIKPNHEKECDHLIREECIRQLKYSGMMEAIRIRQQGFAMREAHGIFYDDYLVLYPGAENLEELVGYLSKQLNLGKDQWQIGRSKVFLRKTLSNKLEGLVTALVCASTRKIQKWWKTMLMHRAATVIQTYVRGGMARKKYHMSRTSAILVVKTVRGFMARQLYRRRKALHVERVESSVCIQRVVRGFLTRLRCSNPLAEYENMASFELDEIILALETDIQSCVFEKNFSKCQVLQTKLTSLSELRKRVRSPSELDQSIGSLNVKLDEALLKKNFQECEKIQDEIQALLRQRSKARENFAPLNAWELDQKKVEYESRAQAALKNKDFDLCRKLQKEVDRIVSFRKKKRTIEELDVDIAKLEDDLNRAIEAKHFGNCSRLQEEIKTLQNERSKMVDSRPSQTIQKASVAARTQLGMKRKDELPVNSPVKVVSLGSQLDTRVVKPLSTSSSITMQAKVPEQQLPVTQASKLGAGPPRLEGGVKAVNSSASHPALTIQGVAAAPVALPLNAFPEKSRNDAMEKPVLNMKKRQSSRLVSRLRLSQATTLLQSLTIHEACEIMKSNHADAALIVSTEGLLTGIITDTDITRRVVSNRRSTQHTILSDVMTPHPSCVTPLDDAMDALFTMLKGKFRHLPVIDRHGYVVGMLNIAKCLFDAVSCIEKAQSVLQKNLQDASSRWSRFGPIIGKMLSPTLRSVIDRDEATAPLVSLSTSIVEVAQMMSASKKAALVVDVDQQLVGIFTPRDMLNRVLGAGLDPAAVVVSQVMTRDPYVLSTDNTVLDAMHDMHDHRILNIPVLEEKDKRLYGLVDVLSLSYGSSDTGDWQDFWITALDLLDEDVEGTPKGEKDRVDALSVDRDMDVDVDDGRESMASLRSFRSESSTNRKEKGSIGTKSITTSTCKGLTSTSSRNRNEAELPSTCQARSDVRSVLKLRPSKAVVITEHDSVTEGAVQMKASRSDAALVVSSEGFLAGIVTDTDITRSVVASDPQQTRVGSIMTPHPKFVTPDSNAIEALCMMLEGKFRHLPVVDQQGCVVGVLSIAKCLYDAIKRMEASSLALKESLVAQTSGNGALKGFLGPMMDQIFAPKIKSVVDGMSSPPIVRRLDTVRQAAEKMALSKRGALVVENGLLVGIFTAKDLLFRVISCHLSIDEVLVEEVMTPSPVSVTPNATVLETLMIMHENKFLHLPVVYENGEVAGLVDVIAVTCGSNKDDWRLFWDSSLATTDDDSKSIHSDRSNDRSTSSRKTDSSLRSKRSTAAKSWASPSSHLVRSDKEPVKPLSTLLSSSSAAAAASSNTNINTNTNMTSTLPKAFTTTAFEEGNARKRRTVAQLRPKKVLHLAELITVAEAARRMRRNRVDAAVVTTDAGELLGILTDTDITRRVVALDIDPESCSVSSVMTLHPHCVRMSDDALDALAWMIEGHFKHLPVVGDGGGGDDAEEEEEEEKEERRGLVKGMLDISSCLFDAVKKMEDAQLSKSDVTLDLQRELSEVCGNTRSTFQEYIEGMVEKLMSPTLEMTLGDDPVMPPMVQKDVVVSEVARLMAQTKKAAVVLDGEEFVGILTPRDIMMHLVAKDLSADRVSVSSIMSKNPETFERDTSVMDAFRIMHDTKEVYIPVMSATGKVVGMADVLSLSFGLFSSGSKATDGDWRSFWHSAMALQDSVDEQLDETTSIGTIEEFERTDTQSGYQYSDLDDSVSVLDGQPKTTFLFKVKDASHNTHRIRCSPQSLQLLLSDVASKMHAHAHDLVLKYTDDEGDVVVLTSDASLQEAVSMARLASWKSLLLLVEVKSAGSSESQGLVVVKAAPLTGKDALPGRRINTLDFIQRGVVITAATTVVLGALVVIGYVFSRKSS